MELYTDTLALNFTNPKLKKFKYALDLKSGKVYLNYFNIWLYIASEYCQHLVSSDSGQISNYSLEFERLPNRVMSVFFTTMLIACQAKDEHSLHNFVKTLGY